MEIDPRHGVPYERAEFETLISRPQPHGYVWRDGMLYAMPGGSSPHTLFADKLGELLRAVFGWRGPCRVFRDKYVEIPNHTALLPDLIVSCAGSDMVRLKATGTDSSTVQYPRLIAEVLSPESTAVYAATEKRLLYQRCPALEVYLLLDQDKPHVTAYRRSSGWQAEQYVEQQVLPLPEFGMNIALDDLYTDILADLENEIRNQMEQQ